MSTTFNCPACQQLIAAEVEPGTQVMCPLCRQIVAVPGQIGGAPAAGPGGPHADFGGPSASGRYPLQGLGAGVLPYGVIPQNQGSQGLAIGALVCGIVGVLACMPVGLVGLIMGIVALVRIRRDPQVYRGRGLAIGGVVTGGISVLMVPVMIAILLPALSHARDLSKRAVCASNLQGIGQALYIYASENNEMFPDASADWQACLAGGGYTTSQQFVCPSTAGFGNSYQYVPGYGTASDPAQIIVFEDLINHQGQGGNILYLDGHAAWVPSPQFEADIAAIKLPNGQSWKAYIKQKAEEEGEESEAGVEDEGFESDAEDE